MRIKARPISEGIAEGEIVFYNPKKKVKDYKNKIVVIENLNAIRKTFRAREAEAIIAEQGALTSHGAILARELKKPCIILPGARKIFKEGLWAEFDNTGFIDVTIRYKFRLESYQRFRPIKKGNWLLIRPRQPSTFKNGFSVLGARDIPKILSGSTKKGECRVNKKGIWYKNCPSPRSLVNRIINDPKWFQQKLKERRIIFNEVKRYSQYLIRKIRKKKFSSKDYLEDLERGKDILIKTIPYRYLTQLSIDRVEESFYNFLHSFLSIPLVTRCLDCLIKSSYVDKVIKARIMPPKRLHEFVFPAPPVTPAFIQIRPRYYREIRLDKEINVLLKKQKAEIREKFHKYSQILPLLTELSEETTYTCRIFRNCLNHVIERIAKHLVRKKKIKKVEDILDFTVDEVIDMIRS